MDTATKAPWRFVSFAETEQEHFPNKSHFWYCRPDMANTERLLFVRAQIQPGQGHHFHYHPGIEEILYVLEGQAEQWVETEKRLMQSGDSLFISTEIIHATFNPGPDVLDFLAVLTPANTGGPVTVEVGDREPWKTRWPGASAK